MDNSTAAEVVNNTIVPRRSKMMDMRFWWLRCHTSQDQFRYYWDAGSKNWANYNTKHHPDTYHEAHWISHAGIWDWVGTWNQPSAKPLEMEIRFPTYLSVAKTNPPKNCQKLLRPEAEKWRPRQKSLRPEAEKSAKNESSEKSPKIAKTRSWKMVPVSKIA